MTEKLTVGERFDKIDARARAIIKEQVGLNKDTSRNMVRLAGELKKGYALFEAKQPGTKIGGFSNFKAWMVELIEPINMSARSGFYHLSIGRRLLGLVSGEQLEELGIEKAKTLARVVKSKGKLPEGMLEHAKETKSDDLRKEVDVELYKGNPQHDEGPRDSFTLVAGVKVIKNIQNQIKRLRPAVAEEGAELPPSDAHVVEFALADCLSGIDEAELEEMEKLRKGK